jgi:hypothetical protein
MVFFRACNEAVKRFKLKLREFQMVLRGLVSTRHRCSPTLSPLDAVTCLAVIANEYDDFFASDTIEACSAG